MKRAGSSPPWRPTNVSSGSVMVPVKYLLYPILLPVVAVYELGRWAWSRVGSSFLLVIILAYFFGPTISISIAIEAANYTWESGKHWSVCTLTALTSFVVLLGVIWPLFIICSKPLLFVINYIVSTALRRLIQAFELFFDLLANIGTFTPLASYWRAVNVAPYRSSVFLFLLIVYAEISVAYHSLWIIIPIWTEINAYFGMLPFTILTQIVASLWALSVPITAVLLVGVTVFGTKHVSYTVGAASTLSAVNVILLSALKTYSWAEVLPSVLGGFLALFWLIFPSIDILSQKNFLKELVSAAARLWNAFYRHSKTAWKTSPAIDWALLTFIPFINTSSVYYICSTVLGLNAWLTAGHIVFFVGIETIGFDTTVVTFPLLTLAAVHFAFERLASPHVIEWSSLIFRFGAFAPTIWISGALGELVLLPIFSPIMVLFILALRPLPMRVTHFAVTVRTKLRLAVDKVATIIRDYFHSIFFDRSSFGTMVGWVMTAFLISLAIVASLLTSYSPLTFIPSYARAMLGPTIFSFSFQAQPQLNGTIPAATRNTTLPLDTPSEDPPAFFLCGNFIGDSVIMVSLALNAMIFLGKLASTLGATSFCVVAGVAYFLYIRHLPWVATNYPIITTLASAELAVLATAVTVAVVYGGLLRITRPYVAKYAPIICIPFERLFSLQRWVFLVTAHQCSLVWRALVAVWDSLFAPKPVHVQPQPMFVRPRRYQ